MFISNIRAGGMDDRSPWGDFWFEPVTRMASSGMFVSPETATQLAAVFRAVNLISGHIAMLPLRINKAGTYERIEKHWLYKLFKNPNPWQNGFEWRRLIMGHLLLRGTAYNRIIDNAKGEVEALIPLHPDHVKIELLDGGNDFRYRYTDDSGQEQILVRGEVWKLMGYSANGYTGLSVIECARESLSLGLSAQAYGNRFFGNDARPASGWVEYPGQFANKEARKSFREQMQEAQSDKNRGKIMVLDRGMSYHEVGLNNQDAQFLETRKFQISEIARWFGLPPHKLGDLDRATFSNIEQQAQEYVTDSLLIWAETIEAGIENTLLFDDEGLDPELSFDQLLRGDSQTRYANYQSGINAGWLVRNQARAAEHMEPIPGLDEPLRPLNMAEESEAEAQETTGGEQENNDQTDQSSAQRFQSLIESNARRLSRRIEKAGGVAMKDATLVAESMAVSYAAAKSWCAVFCGAPLEPDDTATLYKSLVRLGSKGQ